LLAVIVGVPALRLRGIYLALATIAFVEILRVVSLNLEITGGAVGIFGIPQPFENSLAYGFLVFPLLLIVMFFVFRLERSRIGRAFIAIREDELAADAMGINPTYHKVLAFVMGAILAGIVGAISAHFLNTWNARQGTFDASINSLAYVLIGGSRTFIGPVMGGLILTALPEVLRDLKDLRLIVNGLLLTIGAIYLPQGLITPELFKRFSRKAGKS
jgi:branched-chain amino acid transport system permease protein